MNVVILTSIVRFHVLSTFSVKRRTCSSSNKYYSDLTSEHFMKLYKYYNFGGFHRTLQRVRLANRGRLLLRTPGPVPFWTCICSNVETILS